MVRSSMRESSFECSDPTQKPRRSVPRLYGLGNTVPDGPTRFGCTLDVLLTECNSLHALPALHARSRELTFQSDVHEQHVSIWELLAIEH